MRTKYRKRLKLSIKHWVENYRIVEEAKPGIKPIIYRSSYSCACCNYGIPRSPCMYNIYSCVVSEYTNELRCRGTPWKETLPRIKRTKGWLNAIEKEIRFLMNIWYCAGYAGDPLDDMG